MGSLPGARSHFPMTHKTLGAVRLWPVPLGPQAAWCPRGLHTPARPLRSRHLRRIQVASAEGGSEEPPAPPSQQPGRLRSAWDALLRAAGQGAGDQGARSTAGGAAAQGTAAASSSAGPDPAQPASGGEAINPIESWEPQPPEGTEDASEDGWDGKERPTRMGRLGVRLGAQG